MPLCITRLPLDFERLCVPGGASPLEQPAGYARCNVQATPSGKAGCAYRSVLPRKNLDDAPFSWCHKQHEASVSPPWT